MDLISSVKVKLILLGLALVIQYIPLTTLLPLLTHEFSLTLKGGQLPTSGLNPYSRTQLQALARTLRNSSNPFCVHALLGITVFIRQILPISGLYHQQLVGHVYGTLTGFLLCYSLEVAGSCVLYLLTWACMSSDWDWAPNLWSFLLYGISHLDGSYQEQTQHGIERPEPTVRTRVLATVLLALVRALALIPSWMVNHVLVEMGVNGLEFIASTLLGAAPSALYAVHQGENLMEALQPAPIWTIYCATVASLGLGLFAFLFQFI